MRADLRRLNLQAKKPTRLKDIAALAKVSEVAVGRVLLGSGSSVRVSQQTAEAIRKIAQDLGYRPNSIARQLRGKRSNVLGAVIDSNVSNPYFELLSEIEREASNMGFRLMIGETRGDINRLKEYVADFSMRGTDGVIWMAHDYPDIADAPKVTESVLSGLAHVVFIGRPQVEAANLCYVDLDRADAVRQAVEHLLSKGRDRIAFVLPDYDVNAIRERKRGYVEAHRAHGIRLEPERMCVWPALASRGVVQEDLVRSAVKGLLGKTDVDAILASNDVAAVYAIKTCEELGLRVPEDIAVFGFDNILIASLFRPSITTIDRNLSEQARATVRLLNSLIEDKTLEPSQRHIVVKPKLVVRESA